MKTKLLAFSRSYEAALSKHLKRSPTASATAAHRLGLRAVKLGLETLDLARIHEDALIALVLPNYSSRASDGMVRRAGEFFAEAITPIEETHRGAREANTQMRGMIETLNHRTLELAAANKELKQEIVQRTEMEDSLRTSETTSSLLLEKSRQMQEELRYLSRRLLSAQEDERKRISRELHDVIAQTLTGINLRLTTLKLQSTANTKDLREKIAITQRLVEKSVEIVHRFARDLRPSVLDDLGLIPALRSYIKDFAKQTGVDVTFTAFAAVEKLESGARTMLYRVAQEALTNVSRHARAKTATVRIRRHNGAICMEIHDDGRGFKVEDGASARTHNRLGLLGMRERVEMIGGTLSVESAPGRETTLRVQIPFNPPPPTPSQPKKSVRPARKTP